MVTILDPTVYRVTYPTVIVRGIRCMCPASRGTIERTTTQRHKRRAGEEEFMELQRKVRRWKCNGAHEKFTVWADIQNKTQSRRGGGAIPREGQCWVERRKILYNTVMAPSARWVHTALLFVVQNFLSTSLLLYYFHFIKFLLSYPHRDLGIIYWVRLASLTNKLTRL
jgi:hypothetical protein